METPSTEVVAERPHITMPERVVAAGKKIVVIRTFGYGPNFGAQLFVKLLAAPPAVAYKETDVPFHRVAGIDVLAHGAEIAADEEARCYFIGIGNYFLA